MAPRKDGKTKKIMNRGAWTTEEDQKLAQCIQTHGAKKWKTVSIKSGLNRCGKSCRLRWLNYLRPNIKRGNISEEEEDLILRLHKLLGNRFVILNDTDTDQTRLQYKVWSLIAGRLPGRTDNEIKNYWNSHLCKKVNQIEEKPETSTTQETIAQDNVVEDSAMLENKDSVNGSIDSDVIFDVNEFLDFSTEESYGFDWVNKFLELDQIQFLENTERSE